MGLESTEIVRVVICKNALLQKCGNLQYRRLMFELFYLYSCTVSSATEFSALVGNYYHNIIFLSIEFIFNFIFTLILPLSLTLFNFN